MSELIFYIPLVLFHAISAVIMLLLYAVLVQPKTDTRAVVLATIATHTGMVLLSRTVLGDIVFAGARTLTTWFGNYMDISFSYTLLHVMVTIVLYILVLRVLNTFTRKELLDLAFMCFWVHAFLMTIALFVLWPHFNYRYPVNALVYAGLLTVLQLVFMALFKLLEKE